VFFFYSNKFLKEDSMLSLKKSLVFGCALLLTALVFFTGCPSPSSSDIFVPVTDITGVPATGTEGAEVDLSAAAVVPAEANYRTINWSVKDDGNTGLSDEGIVNAKFTPAQPGTLVLTATIANGRAEGTNYTKDFTITIDAIQLPSKVSGVSLVEGNLMLGVAWDAATGATGYEVYYSTDTTPPATAAKTVDEAFADITSLTNGTSYNVWVKAKNNLGVSKEFSEVANGTPATPVLGNLVGTWASEYGEEYIIEDMEFTSAWGGSTTYKGPIVHIRQDTAGNNEKGYITIRYTENTYSPEAVGNYYVIRWEDLTAGSTIKISGAAIGYSGDGFSTISETETTYSGTIGEGDPFASGSDCYFIAGEGMSSAIIGRWVNGYDIYTITDRLVIYSYGTTMFVGEIVNVRNLSNDNYITFKFITNEAPYTSLVGKYCVLYWTNLNTAGETTTADMAAVYQSSRPGDEGQDTQTEAESTYNSISAIDDEGASTFTRQ
jgi:hypothetical protein